MPEGRQVFAPLSVEDNLRLGAWTAAATTIASRSSRSVYRAVPDAGDKRQRPAGDAVGRPAADAGDRPRADGEAAAPAARRAVDGAGARCWSIRFSASISALKRAGLTVLLVEQNARAALAIADRGYVVETGRIAASGSGAELLADDRVQVAYLGV